jgi:cell division protein FtsL
VAEGGVMRNEGTLRVALAIAALLCSLSLVIWRQSQAFELLGELDEARTRRAATESEKSRLISRIQALESRARITSVAGELWGMRVPASHEEFVILMRPGQPEERPRARPRMVRAGMLEGVANLIGERD